MTLLSDDTYDNKVTQSEKEAKNMITYNLMQGHGKPQYNPVSQQNSNETNGSAGNNNSNSNNNKDLKLPGNK